MNFAPTASARPTTFAIALAAAAALTLGGCAGSEAPEAPADAPLETSAPATSDNTEAPANNDSPADAESGEVTMPADFPADYVLLPDGELIAAEGAAPKWTVTKSIALVDQVTAAVRIHEKSYGFTIDEFNDGEWPNWLLSNDQFTLDIDVTEGDPVTVTYVVEAR
jgi:hypothetical protein